MTVPLPDAQLAAITASEAVRAEVLSALSTAGAYCGGCGFEPGETGCPDCARVRGWYADAVMPITERLRAELAQAREARLEWSRTADHPELVHWAEALVDADLTPHPAFAFRSTTTGYEVAVQVATTDALRDGARAELLAELRKALDATICRVLGYRPAVARQADDTTSKVVAAPMCRCGHHKKQHSGIGPGQQCDVCPGDDEQSWRHPYTPEES